MCLFIYNFLAPPAERQRSFSNAELSVVRRRRRQLFTYKLVFTKTVS